MSQVTVLFKKENKMGKRMFRSVASLLVLAGMMSYSAISNAEVTLKVEPGVATSLGQPQVNRFNAGGAVAVKPLVSLTSWFDVGPSLSLLALDSDLKGVDTGTAWGVGGTARVKRPHNYENTGTGFGAVSPWLDVDAKLVDTGGLLRYGTSVGVGASVPTSSTRSLWVGPFARYDNILQTASPKTNSNDSHVLILGLSLEFDLLSNKQAHLPPNPPKEEAPKVTPPVVAPPAPTPPASVPEVRTMHFMQRIQFPWDSAVLQPSQSEALKSVLSDLNNLCGPGCKVQVEGHASSEGKVAHNDKLSIKRANAVVDFLVTHGVSRDKLTAVGFGSSVPVANNATEAGRVANRRVEFDVKFTVVTSDK